MALRPRSRGVGSGAVPVPDVHVVAGRLTVRLRCSGCGDLTGVLVNGRCAGCAALEPVAVKSFELVLVAPDMREEDPCST